MSAALKRAVHAACHEHGLDTDARRDLQRRVTGKDSLTEMTPDEIRALLDHLNGGAARRGQARDTLPRGATTGKLRALWISGWHLGAVRDRTDRALASFIRRQAGLDAARWAHDPADAAKAIHGLEAWLAREAGVDWAPYATPLGVWERPRARVLEAQWRILHRLGRVRIGNLAALDAYADRHVKAPGRRGYLLMTDTAADALIRHFGDRIRQAKTREAQT